MKLGASSLRKRTLNWEATLEVVGRVDAGVAIVGYGPTGQALALLLAKKGRRVTVVERWPDLYPLPRAVHFDQEAARIFQAAGVIQDVAAVTEDISAYQWRNANRDLLLELDWTGRGLSGWPVSNMFSQPELERVLDRHIKAEPLIEVLQGWAAVDIAQDSRGAALTIAHGEDRDGAWSATGDRVTIHAPYLVGADGANSFVRQALNIPVHDLGFAFDWLVVDVVPNAEREWSPKTWQLCDPKRPTTIVPGGPGRRRWEFMLLPGEQASDMNRVEVAWDSLSTWGVTPANATLERHAVYTFRAQWAARWREGRTLLAGDAAHLMPPFAGQGMCSGLRDACALAWRLDLALKGVTPDSVFDSYGPERLGHVQAMIDFSVELGKVICITDPDLAAQRDRDMLAARAKPDYRAPPPLLPRLGPGLYVDDAPGAGSLSPQGVIVANGRQGLFDDVIGARFAVIAQRGGDLESLTSDNIDALKTLDAALVALDGPGSILDVDGVYHAWLDALESTAVIVRPDFYVYGGARTANELNELVSRLRRALALRPVNDSQMAGAPDAVRQEA